MNIIHLVCRVEAQSLRGGKQQGMHGRCAKRQSFIVLVVYFTVSLDDPSYKLNINCVDSAQQSMLLHLR